jgi:serine/threonine protein kinase
MPSARAADGYGCLMQRGWCSTCQALFRSGFARCPLHGTELVVSDADPLVGTVFADRYVIEDVLGEGGLGRVYRARHLRMSRRYAVKVPFGDVAFDAMVRERFLREAEIVSRLEHPNIVAVVDVGETEAGLAYMAMDLAEGPTLSSVIEAGPLPTEGIRRIAIGIANGLAHAHERGVIHRDLKPDNVILAADDDVHIVDFGIAALRDGATRPRLTTEGTIIGTLEYMAPEQTMGMSVDERTDLFALGVMIYEMASGLLPFTGAAIEVAMQQATCAPPRIAERAPHVEVDPRIEELALQLMAKNPADRPASASVVVALLRAGVSPTAETESMPAVDEPALAPSPLPLAMLSPSPSPSRSRRGALFLSIALAPVVAFATWAAVRSIRASNVELVRPADAAMRGTPPTPRVSAPPTRAVAPDVPPTMVPPKTDPATTPPAIDGTPSSRTASQRRSKSPPPARIAEPTRPPPSMLEPIAPRATAPATAKTLTDLYRTVGDTLVRFRAKHGDDAARPYLDRYEAIDYLSATRHTELREQALAQLRTLDRDLRR